LGEGRGKRVERSVKPKKRNKWVQRGRESAKKKVRQGRGKGGVREEGTKLVIRKRGEEKNSPKGERLTN